MRGVAGFERGLGLRMRVAGLFRLRLQRLFRRGDSASWACAASHWASRWRNCASAAQARLGRFELCAGHGQAQPHVVFPRRQRQGMLAQAFGFVGIGLPLRRQFGLRVALGGGLFRARQLQRGVP